MYKAKRKLLSQNFLRNRKLVKKLVDNSSIGKSDIVVEIGPGKGIITRELAKKAQTVIGVEIDRTYYEYVRENIPFENFIVYNSDFLSYQLPKIPYKVFANPPFSIEGKIVRKLLENPNPPQDCYLVLVKEFACRLMAKKQLNMFYVSHSPWFDFSIAYTFKRTDFTPIPNVQPVLFRFTQKNQPLLPSSEKNAFRNFIKTGFSNGLAIRQNLKKKYPIDKVDAILHELSISKKAKPTQLTLPQWVALYQGIQ